jgi:hypothetical protein
MGGADGTNSFPLSRHEELIRHDMTQMRESSEPPAFPLKMHNRT